VPGKPLNLHETLRPPLRPFMDGEGDAPVDDRVVVWGVLQLCEEVGRRPGGRLVALRILQMALKNRLAWPLK